MSSVGWFAMALSADRFRGPATVEVQREVLSSNPQESILAGMAWAFDWSELVRWPHPGLTKSTLGATDPSEGVSGQVSACPEEEKGGPHERAEHESIGGGHVPVRQEKPKLPKKGSWAAIAPRGNRAGLEHGGWLQEGEVIFGLEKE